MKKSIAITVLAFILGIQVQAHVHNSVTQLIKAGSTVSILFLQGQYIRCDGQTKTIHMEERGDLTIKGDHNVITVKGKTATLRIIGTGNQVHLEQVSAVVIAGDENQVRYDHAEDKVIPRVVGKNNKVDP